MLTTPQFYAGNVRRWQSYPAMWHSKDCIKSHQIRCVGLVYDFVQRPSSTLIEGARWHDQAEVILGDMPFIAKRDWPLLAAAYDEAERVVINRYYVQQPANDWEHQVVKFVDRLDAYMMVLEYAPDDLDLPDWTDANDVLYASCRSLEFDADLLRAKIGD